MIKMKTVDFGKIAVMLLAGLCLGACTGDMEPAVTPEEPKGEPVSLSFVMYEADATTRAAVPANTFFTIYAYSDGNKDMASPDAEGVYTVQADGTATGDMRLYRGKYNLYMVPYNSADKTPMRTAGDKYVDVLNGNDFMHTHLTDLTVLPASAGASSMLVPLTIPFKRMGAQVQLRVKANGSDHQPIIPNSLVVNRITVEGLPDKLSFPLGGTDWETAGVGYTGSVRYETFSSANSVYDFSESEQKVLLPVDGSALLKFTVNLTVGYNDKGETKSVTDDYVTSIQKVLLPGMKYVFDFTLTFYGILTPSDLTLTVRGYTTTPLPSDEIGK